LLVAIKRTYEASHLKLLSTRLRRQTQLVHFAVIRIEDRAAFPVSRAAVGPHAFDDRHATYRLIFSGARAFVASGVAFAGIQNLLDATRENAISLDDADVRSCLSGFVIDRLP